MALQEKSDFKGQFLISRIFRSFLEKLFVKNLSLEEHFLVLTFFISSLILNFDAL